MENKKLEVYEAYIEAKEFKEFQNVKLHLFNKAERQAPIVPYEEAILNYAKYSEHQKSCLHACLEEGFSFQEILDLQMFFQLEYGVQNFHYQKYDLPFDQPWYPKSWLPLDWMRDQVILDSKNKPPFRFVVYYDLNQHDSVSGGAGNGQM